MSELMISVAGIRGIVGDSIKPDEFTRYALAFAAGCRPRRVVVGCDPRPSREMVRRLVFAALEASGCEAIDLGVCPTPTVGLMTAYLQAGGGVAVTASHNPVQWNALKFFRADGTFMNKKDNEKLLRRFREGAFALVPVQRLGAVVEFARPWDEHLRRVLEFVDVAAIRRARLRVALDACNGAGSLIVPALLERLGCQVEIIHDQMNGTFPRGAEPLPENLTALTRAVARHGAAVGFALDPDADRLALVDENGRPVGEERTITLVANHLLGRLRTAVTINLSTTRAVEDVCAAHGVRCHRAAVGEANVVSAMKRRRSRLGGEGNGGVIVPDVHYGRDALTGIAVLLEALALEGVTLSEYNAEVHDYTLLKDKVPVGGLDPEAIYRRARERLGRGASVDRQDGMRLDYGYSWVHLRPSGTEPIFRVFAEAPTREEARSLLERARETILQ